MRLNLGLICWVDGLADEAPHLGKNACSPKVAVKQGEVSTTWHNKPSPSAPWNG
jgi:hypothetical protein